MPEYAQILSQNVLDRAASLSGNENTGYELERMRDGHRHTWWQAPSTASQTINIYVENLVTNGDFEVDVSGWVEVGAGAGSFSRNTTSPIAGDADCEVIATVADSGANIYIVFHYKPIFLKGGRTYRMMLRSKATGAQKQFRFGFLRENLTEDSDFYSNANSETTVTEHYKDVTPDTDEWFRPYIRMLEAATIQFDEFYVGEIREIDTLIIDRGHNLLLAQIKIEYSNTLAPAWITALANTIWRTKAPIYLTFTAKQALIWQITISVLTDYGAIETAKVPQLYLGKRWTMPHHFSGQFDPHEKQRFDNMIVGDRGIAQRSLKYNQRIFRGRMSHLSSSDYADVEKFFEDTDNGLKPFFFIWQPTSDINDILFMRLRGSRNIPYQGGALRDWAFEAEEVVGARLV